MSNTNRAARRARTRLRGPGYTCPDRSKGPPRSKRARVRRAYFAAIVARRRAARAGSGS